MVRTSVDNRAVVSGLSYGGLGRADGLAVVRQMFEAFARRDVEGVLALAHPDIEFMSHGTGRVVERSTPYRGHDGIRRYFADVAAVWTRLEVTPQDYRAGGQGVVVFGHVHAEGPFQQVDTAAVWTWRLADGLVRWGSVTPMPSPGQPRVVEETGGSPG